MNNHRCGRIVGACMVIWLTTASPAYAIIDAVDELETAIASSDGTIDAALARAEEVIADGKRTVTELRASVAQLEDEKAELESVRTTLTSGLIGAIVTALVAIFGTVFRSIGSRIERDLKRLEVLDKMNELRDKGVAIPPRMETSYGSRS